MIDAQLLKVCSKCGEDKKLSEFNKRNASKDGYAYQCRECCRANLRSHYDRNKTYYYDRNTRRRKEKSLLWKSIKSKLKCERCGENHPATLDFHHLDPTEKENSVSQLALQGASEQRLQEEVEKCIILCANCHRKEHYSTTG